MMTRLSGDSDFNRLPPSAGDDPIDFYILYVVVYFLDCLTGSLSVRVVTVCADVANGLCRDFLFGL